MLLFDEPTSALDPELVREVNQTIGDLAHTGITMPISTHDIAFAATVADRIVFLQDGLLAEEGPPAILEHPRTEPFSAFLRHELGRPEPSAPASTETAADAHAFDRN